MDEIAGYYSQTSEADRLTAGSGLLELARTQEILLRYLPKPPARVLDVGGGPGVYAEWLASLGYEVYLFDPVPKHVAEASKLGLADAQLGDARELPCKDNSADAVLLMGPLYHLPERTDRIQAIREAHRALRTGGVLCAAAISRFASMLHSLVDGFVDDDAFWPILQRDLAEGLHRNDTGNLNYFTTSYFHRAQDLIVEFADGGFPTSEVLAVEGPGWLAKDLEGRWKDASRRERMLTLIRQVEREAALIGASLHLIAIGRKTL